jgi:hypothetical protein
MCTHDRYIVFTHQHMTVRKQDQGMFSGCETTSYTSINNRDTVNNGQEQHTDKYCVKKVHTHTHTHTQFNNYKICTPIVQSFKQYTRCVATAQFK